jgi:hypothetical protein
MVNQPQVYGTQYMSSKGGPYGQEPYNRDLISDALRGELGVPSLAKQNERLEQMRALQAQQHAKP